MKESFWGLFIVGVGIGLIFFIYFFQSLTNSEEHGYAILKETTEAAMYDSFDLAAYRATGSIRIVPEKFTESFLRRFAENANLAQTYVVDILDISAEPPKVSVRVKSYQNSGEKFNFNINEETINFDVVNTIDAILETPY
jgi:hypothetical protein